MPDHPKVGDSLTPLVSITEGAGPSFYVPHDALCKMGLLSQACSSLSEDGQLPESGSQYRPELNFFGAGLPLRARPWDHRLGPENKKLAPAETRPKVTRIDSSFGEHEHFRSKAEVRPLPAKIHTGGAPKGIFLGFRKPNPWPPQDTSLCTVKLTAGPPLGPKPEFRIIFDNTRALGLGDIRGLDKGPLANTPGCGPQPGHKPYTRPERRGRFGAEAHEKIKHLLRRHPKVNHSAGRRRASELHLWLDDGAANEVVLAQLCDFVRCAAEIPQDDEGQSDPQEVSCDLLELPLVHRPWPACREVNANGGDGGAFRPDCHCGPIMARRRYRLPTIIQDGVDNPGVAPRENHGASRGASLCSARKPRL